MNNSVRNQGKHQLAETQPTKYSPNMTNGPPASTAVDSYKKQSTGKDLNYGIGYGHERRLDTTKLLEVGDCSAFASLILGRALGLKNIVPLTTLAFSANPLQFKTISAHQLQNIEVGQLVQANYAAGPGHFGHTFFVYKSKDGRLEISDYRGGKGFVSQDLESNKDAKSLLSRSIQRGATFYVVDQNSEHARDVLSTGKGIDWGAVTPFSLGGFGNLSALFGPINNYLSSFDKEDPNLDAHREQELRENQFLMQGRRTASDRENHQMASIRQSSTEMPNKPRPNSAWTVGKPLPKNARGKLSGDEL